MQDLACVFSERTRPVSQGANVRCASLVLVMVTACVPSQRITSAPRGSGVQFFASRICVPNTERFDHPARVDRVAIQQLVRASPSPPPMREPGPGWAIVHETAMEAIEDHADELELAFTRLDSRRVICVTNRRGRARYALAVRDGRLLLIAVMRTPTGPSTTDTRAIAYHSGSLRGRGLEQPRSARPSQSNGACRRDRECGPGARCGLDPQRRPVCRTRAFDGRPNQQYPGVRGSEALPEYVIRDALLASWDRGFRVCADPWLGSTPLVHRASHHRVEVSWFIDGPSGRVERIQVDGVWLLGQALPEDATRQFEACLNTRRADVSLPATTTRRQLYRWSRGFWTAGPHHDGPMTTAYP